MENIIEVLFNKLHLTINWSDALDVQIELDPYLNLYTVYFRGLRSEFKMTFKVSIIQKWSVEIGLLNASVSDSSDILDLRHRIETSVVRMIQSGGSPLVAPLNVALCHINQFLADSYGDLQYYLEQSTSE